MNLKLFQRWYLPSAVLLSTLLLLVVFTINGNITGLSDTNVAAELSPNERSTNVDGAVRRIEQWLGELLPLIDERRAADFQAIFDSNAWNSYQKISGSASEEDSTRAGPGSTMSYTVLVREYLGKFITEYGIRTVADLSCSEMLWQRSIPGFKDLERFAGYDIVPEAIGVARVRTKDLTNVELGVRDMVRDPLPRAFDLVIVRDTLFHLPITDALQVLALINASGSKYLGTTYIDDDTVNNVFIAPGEWYPINLRKMPFLFPAPISWTLEGEPGVDMFGKKKFGIWKLPIRPDKAWPASTQST